MYVHVNLSPFHCSLETAAHQEATTTSENTNANSVSPATWLCFTEKMLNRVKLVSHDMGAEVYVGGRQVGHTFQSFMLQFTGPSSGRKKMRIAAFDHFGIRKYLIMIRNSRLSS